MSRASKFATAILLLVVATPVETCGRLAAEVTLREYRIEPQTDGYAGLSPTAPEVAVFGPASVPGSNRLLVTILDYRRQQEPVATLSGQVRFIDWKVLLPRPGFLRYSPGGHSLLVYDGESAIHVYQLDREQPREARMIDIGLSGERPYFRPVDIEWAPDNRHVAVVFSFEVFHLGVVRVYDVTNGQVQWERSFDLVEMGGEAWSPDGRKLAVTLLSGAPSTAYPKRDIPNLLELDGDSGRTLLSIKTGDRAGPVCFAPDNAILTAPLHFQPQGHDRWNHEKVKVWDATTGRLIRQIASPGRDIHDRLELSRDGKVLLGYVGKERSGFVLRYLEQANQVLDRKFELFDYKSGKVAATSSNLTEDGFCGNSRETWTLLPILPSFRLSAHGDRVLVYWPSRACAPSVFEVSGTP